MDVALLIASSSLSIYLPKCVVLASTNQTSFSYKRRRSHDSMALAIGLSLWLFSLSLLEAVPRSWMIFLSPDDVHNPATVDDQITGGEEESSTTHFVTSVGSWTLPLSHVYLAVLWCMSLLILVAFPAMAGAAVMEGFGHVLCPKKLPQSSPHHEQQVGDEETRKKQQQGILPFSCRQQSTSWNCYVPWWLRFFVGLVHIVFKNLWNVLMVTLCRPLFRLLRCDCCRSTGGSGADGTLVMTIHDEDIRKSTSTSSMDRMTFKNNGTSPTNASGITSVSGSRVSWSKRRIFLWVVGSVGGVSIVLVLVSSLGPLVVHTSSDKNTLSTLVSWLCAFGLLLSSLMNGFGSVSMPYTCLAGLYLQPVPPTVILSQEQELQSLQDALRTKKEALSEATLAVSFQSGSHGGATAKDTVKTNSNKNSQKRSFMGSMRAFTSMGDEVGNRRQLLKTEIKFMETLCSEVKEDIDDLLLSQQQAAAARTPAGKFKSYVGLVFSVILLIRLASAGMTMWKNYYTTIDTNRQKVADGDIVTTLLLWLTGHDIISPKDYAMISQLVSLVLTALLSFTQVRTFLRTITTVHKKLSRLYAKFYCLSACNRSGDGGVHGSGTIDEPDGADSKIFWQIAAGATGSYCLSCIVLIKMMLPEDFCLGFSTALGGMDIFTIHRFVVDSVFASSAAVSVAILAMLFGIQRQNNLRHMSIATQDSKKMIVRGMDAC